MSRHYGLLSLVALFACGTAAAQEYKFGETTTVQLATPVTPPATITVQPMDKNAVPPELQRYMTERTRALETPPVDLTRERAQREAEQRKERLNAMRWYGYSNSRPVAAVTPFTGTYGPRWVGNVRSNPFYWRDQGHMQTYNLGSQGGIPTLR